MHINIISSYFVTFEHKFYQLECIVPPYFDDVLTMQFWAFNLPNYTVRMLI